MRLDFFKSYSPAMTNLQRLLRGIGFVTVGLLVVVIVGGFTTVLIWVATTIETDWTQFVPDTIVGLFTGLIVAAVVALIVFTRESKEARELRGNLAWARWTAMRSKVAAQLPRPFSFARFRMEEFTAQVDGLLGTVESDTAALLVEYASDRIEKGILASLANAVAEGPELKRRGSDVEQNIRAALFKLQIPYDNVASHTEVAVGLMLGNSSAEVARLMGSDAGGVGAMEPSARAALHQSSQEVAAFMQLAKRYAKNWDVLREFARGEASTS